MSTAKQALTAMYARYSLPHDCRDKLLFKNETHKTFDNAVYCFDTTSTSYTFYFVVHANEDVVRVRRYLTYPYTELGFAWEELGIFRVRGIDENEIVIPRSSLQGKCVLYDDIIVSIPIEIIMN